MRAGDLVDDRFAVENLAGTGAMGAVYRARDRLTGAEVALKVMRGSAAEGPRFAREAQVLAELRHPAIVQYIGHGRTTTGERYLAMEWLEGETLSERLARLGLRMRETVALGLRVAEGLGVAHKSGVIHRDIKPGNLFLPGGLIERVKLFDFGIARLAPAAAAEDERQLTRTGVMIGTPGYMSPEQARGERAIDARADVFSLGCVLFKCLTGRGAFEGDDPFSILVKTVMAAAPRPSELREDIPEPLDDLVVRMLSKAPADRPSDGAAVAAALGALGDLWGESAPLSRRVPSGLTTREQRVLSVVLARPAAPEPGSPSAAPLLETRMDPAADTLSEAELAEYVQAARAAVEARGGNLELIAGGSLLVTVAPSAAATDQAAGAARCALAMRAALPDAPIAVATGRGRVGDRKPAGEAIDRAAALLREAAPTHGLPPIRIDEVTAGLLDAGFDVGGDLSGLILRGVREIGESTRTLLGKPSPCVGRDREIASLEAIFDECIGEPGARAVLVTGPAGVGKSRLRHELLRRIEERREPVEVWIGHGDPMSAGSAFGIIAQAIRRVLGASGGEALPLSRQKIRARVGRHLGRREAAWPTPTEADLGRVSEFLGELVGVPFPDDDSVQLRAARRDAMLMGDQMQRAFHDFLAAECAAQPVVLVLEGLHWGDLPSVTFVDGALRALRDAPLMVVALARPDVHDIFPKLWASREIEEIRLGSLGRRASERLIQDTLGAATSVMTVVRLVEQAAGNAFYLEELIRAVADGKGDALPQTVLAMVQSRLEGLEIEARRVLRAASVFGQVFWKGAVTALLGGDDAAAEAPRWLTTLVDREIIARQGSGRFPGEDEYVFRQALVREAAYAMLTEADRALGHRLAGDWLERAGETEAAVPAEHFERGGEPARAIGWYRRAAEQALEGNDLAAVLERAERGVRCGASGEVLGEFRRLQAAAHRWRGENAQAETRSLEAMRWLPRGSASWYRAAVEALLASSRIGKIAELAEIGREVQGAVLSGRPSGAGVIAWERAAALLLVAGRQDLAEPLIQELEPIAEPIAARDPVVRARIDMLRGLRALAAGDPGTYVQLHALAAVSFDETGDARAAASARLSVGYGHLEIGAYVEAERYLRDAIAATERMGLHAVSANAKRYLGSVLARLGMLDEARATETEAIQTFRDQGNRRMEAASRSELAFICALAGDLVDAERQARLSVELMSESPSARLDDLATLAYVLIARQRCEPALAAAHEALALLESLGGINWSESRVRLVHAEALHATGNTEAARAAIEVARASLLARAAKIKDPSWRASFLDRVPENARTLELARQWGVSGAS